MDLGCVEKITEALNRQSRETGHENPAVVIITTGSNGDKKVGSGSSNADTAVSFVSLGCNVSGRGGR